VPPDWSAGCSQAPADQWRSQQIAFYGAGWQIHAENLAAYVAGREPGDFEARWGELVPPYQELVATIR
jgi:hypothetical protein